MQIKVTNELDGRYVRGTGKGTAGEELSRRGLAPPQGAWDRWPRAKHDGRTEGVAWARQGHSSLTGSFFIPWFQNI